MNVSSNIVELIDAQNTLSNLGYLHLSLSGKTIIFTYHLCSTQHQLTPTQFAYISQERLNLYVFQQLIFTQFCYGIRVADVNQYVTQKSIYTIVTYHWLKMTVRKRFSRQKNSCKFGNASNLKRSLNDRINRSGGFARNKISIYQPDKLKIGLYQLDLIATAEYSFRQRSTV